MSGRRFALLVTPLLALTLAACGDGDDTSAGPSAAPTLSGANPIVATGKAGVKPFVEPQCPTPRRPKANDGVTDAATQITKLGEKRYPGVFAGLVPCLADNRVVVYKLPSGGADLMKAAQQIGRDENVQVSFDDALFSYKQAQRTKRAVLGAFAKLDEAGAPFAVLRVHENGTIEVAVRSNVAAAEKVLADLLDRIYVVLIPEESPSPTP